MGEMGLEELGFEVDEEALAEALSKIGELEESEEAPAPTRKRGRPPKQKEVQRAEEKQDVVTPADEEDEVQSPVEVVPAPPVEEAVPQGDVSPEPPRRRRGRPPGSKNRPREVSVVGDGQLLEALLSAVRLKRARATGEQREVLDWLEELIALLLR